LTPTQNLKSFASKPNQKFPTIPYVIAPGIKEDRKHVKKNAAKKGQSAALQAFYAYGQHMENTTS
jgi:hypothetical protein